MRKGIHLLGIALIGLLFLTSCAMTSKNTTNLYQNVSPNWYQNGYKIEIDNDAPLMLDSSDTLDNRSKWFILAGPIVGSIVNANMNAFTTQRGYYIRETLPILSPAEKSGLAMQEIFEQMQIHHDEESETRLAFETIRWHTEAERFTIVIEMRLYLPGRTSAAIRSRCYAHYDYDDLETHINRIIRDAETIRKTTQASVLDCQEHFLSALRPYTPPLRRQTVIRSANAI